MKKLKLMTIVGTRPEIIKMSESIKLFDRVFDHILVHTGQNYDYELNKIFFDELGVREPDYFLDVVGNDLGETMGNILSNSYSLMKAVCPDALIVLGDTNSCLCVISAKRLKIPIFHMEAGNRCFDENLPEEVNRRIIDITSDLNLCYSEHARRNLLAMGFPIDRALSVGSPMREVIEAHKSQIQSSSVLEKVGLSPNNYIVLSAHREENIDNEDNFYELVSAVNSLAKEYQMPILYSVHPRSKKYIEQRKVSFDARIIMHKPFGFCDFVKLQKNAFCVASDSGTLAEEAAIVKFPAVLLRTSTERPETLDAGLTIMSGLTSRGISQSVKLSVDFFRSSKPSSSVEAYNDANVSEKIAKIVQSYTEYIGRNVWKNC